MVELFPKLSQNLLEILDDDEEYYDITIEVGIDPHVKIFRSHMVILNYRSPYLKRILSTNKKKNDTNLIHIKLPNILPEIFQIILRYIYGGKLSLEEYDTSDIIKILVAANELGLQELIPCLETFLIESKANWMEENFNLIYQTSFEKDSFLKLQKYCINLTSKYPDKIFKSSNFFSIPEKLFISIIQNANLKMSEARVWEHVLKWGIAQNPELSSDPKTYSKDDFNVLKNTLQQYIPLINFRKLTSKEFSDKVMPYKKIFPKELYKNLLKDFLNNDSKPIEKSDDFLDNDSKPVERSDENKEIHIDSKIITSQHAELILKWIDRLEITDKLTSKYEFKLLFRSSRDGIRSRKFHEICDNKCRTVTIIKVEDVDEVLGGYNPIEWKSERSYGATKDSFIFSFKNNDGVENCILSRVKNENKAIRKDFYYGPSFGESDLLMKGSVLSSLLFGINEKSEESPILTRVGYRKNSYEHSIREIKETMREADHCYIEEFEVFQIV